MAEDGAALQGVLGALRLVESRGGGYLGDDAPDLAVGVGGKILAVFCLDDHGHLPYAVGFLLFARQFGVGVSGEATEVAHDGARIGKDIAVEPLQNHLVLIERVAADRNEGVVHVTAAHGIEHNEPPLYVKLID